MGGHKKSIKLDEIKKEVEKLEAKTASLRALLESASPVPKRKPAARRVRETPPALMERTPEGYPRNNEILMRDAAALLESGKEAIAKARDYIMDREEGLPNVTLWVQEWEESERGWGVRPDGYTLHLKNNDITKFLMAMRTREAEIYHGETPDEYTRRSGSPYEWDTDDAELIERVRLSECGIWGPGKTAPKNKE